MFYITSVILYLTFFFHKKPFCNYLCPVNICPHYFFGQDDLLLHIFLVSTTKICDLANSIY